MINEDSERISCHLGDFHVVVIKDANEINIFTDIGMLLIRPRGGNCVTITSTYNPKHNTK